MGKFMVIDNNLELNKRALVKSQIGSVASPEFLDWLEEVNYYIAPAAKSHHGNCRGGLFQHSLYVANQLNYLTDALELRWEREESPSIVGLLHDICKVDDYVFDFRDDNPANHTIEYKPTISGHGSKSIFLLCSRIDLTEEEKACILFHMGAFTDSSEWKYYSNAVSSHPNVLYTHTADMIASQIQGV